MKIEIQRKKNAECVKGQELTMATNDAITMRCVGKNVFAVMTVDDEDDFAVSVSQLDDYAAFKAYPGGHPLFGQRGRGNGDAFVVEKIRGIYRNSAGERKILVEWGNSWIPEENFVGDPKLLKDFEKAHKKILKEYKIKND